MGVDQAGADAAAGGEAESLRRLRRQRAEIGADRLALPAGAPRSSEVGEADARARKSGLPAGVSWAR